MKNIFFIILTFSFYYINVSAQAPDRVIAQVKYRLIHVRDTNDRKRPYTEDLVLLFGRNSSAYSSWDAQKQEKLRNKELQDQVKTSANTNSLDLVLTGTRPVTTTEYFQFLSTQKLFIKQKLNNDYLVEQPLPIINWKILNDTTIINGFHCQKATAHFKGRNYIAWFCADFPIHAGPWKLNGLPGLIMQAADTKGEVVFQFISLEDVRNENIFVKLPVDVVRASQKDIDRLIELQKKNPAAYAKLPTGKISGVLGDIDPARINSIHINSPSTNFGKITNNPIELPEKK